MNGLEAPAVPAQIIHVPLQLLIFYLQFPALLHSRTLVPVNLRIIIIVDRAHLWLCKKLETEIMICEMVGQRQRCY